MKKSKFAEQQIAFALKQFESGVAVSEVCRKMGFSEATFYNWKKTYGGLSPAALRLGTGKCCSRCCEKALRIAQWFDSQGKK